MFNPPLWTSAQPTPGDLNSMRRDGFYYSDAHPQGPVTDSLIFVWVITAPGNRIAQFAIAPSTGGVYVRAFKPSTGWLAWKMLTDVEQAKELAETLDVEGWDVINRAYPALIGGNQYYASISEIVGDFALYLKLANENMSNDGSEPFELEHHAHNVPQYHASPVQDGHYAAYSPQTEFSLSHNPVLWGARSTNDLSLGCVVRMGNTETTSFTVNAIGSAKRSDGWTLDCNLIDGVSFVIHRAGGGIFNSVSTGAGSVAPGATLSIVVAVDNDNITLVVNGEVYASDPLTRTGTRSPDTGGDKGIGGFIALNDVTMAHLWLKNAALDYYDALAVTNLIPTNGFNRVAYTGTVNTDEIKLMTFVNGVLMNVRNPN